MIKIENISKSFEGKLILEDISGKFETGKTNLIIGASGTGKSVLLKCIVGLVQPDSGSIFFDDREFTGADRDLKTEIRREIGMLFQSSALFDSKNVEENVMFPLNILTDMPKDEKLDRVNFVLDRVGLANSNRLMPSELSGGMKKRVGIARAIVNNSRYLFCDEPNSGLDPQTAILIDSLIHEITVEYNITTIVVTHDMNSVMEIGENIIFLYDGQLWWKGSKEDILRTDNKEINDFVYASSFMQSIKQVHREQQGG